MLTSSSSLHRPRPDKTGNPLHPRTKSIMHCRRPPHRMARNQGTIQSESARKTAEHLKSGIYPTIHFKSRKNVGIPGSGLIAPDGGEWTIPSFLPQKVSRRWRCLVCWEEKASKGEWLVMESYQNGARLLTIIQRLGNSSPLARGLRVWFPHLLRDLSRANPRLCDPHSS
jgi:hypothetical protein